MSRVLDRVRETVKAYDLLAPDEMVVMGVSGGPDSVCLLHVMCCLQGEMGLRLHVAHLHHGLRGAEADADAAFVADLAAGWGLGCTVERVDVPGLAAEQGLAFEEAARRARYSFLGRVALSLGAQTVAVGHNADDQAETVLMHWLRGSGLAGLRGILPKISLSDYRLVESPTFQTPGPGLRLVRPLLEVSRDKIEAYNTHYGLETRFDRSNLDTTYFRNWLRHEAIPLLEGHNPNVREVMRRSARVATDEYALLRSLLADAWGQVVIDDDLPGAAVDGRLVFELAAWRRLPVALQRTTLREAIHHLRRSLRNVNYVHVEDARLVALKGTTGAQATLPRGLMLTVDYEWFTIADAEVAEALPDWPLLPERAGPWPEVRATGTTWLPGSRWLLWAEVVEREALPDGWQANEDPWRAFVAADRVAGPMRLRVRRAGDRFRPLGMEGRSVKLADFLTNQKVRRNARDRLPLLVDDGGILWVCGQRLDERARVEEGTEQVYVLRFVRP